MTRVMTKTATAATLAYVERVLRYLASLRYFLDKVDRLLAFVSRAGRKTRDFELSLTHLGGGGANITTVISSHFYDQRTSH